MNLNSFLKAVEDNNNLNVILYNTNESPEYGADWDNEVYNGAIKNVPKKYHTAWLHNIWCNIDSNMNLYFKVTINMDNRTKDDSWTLGQFDSVMDSPCGADIMRYWVPSDYQYMDREEKCQWFEDLKEMSCDSLVIKLNEYAIQDLMDEYEVDDPSYLEDAIAYNDALTIMGFSMEFLGC